MKKSLYRFISLFLAFASSATTLSAKEYTFRGRVTADGKGVNGVVVTNGVAFCQTDVQGRWSLPTDTCISKFVYISTPSDYCLPKEKSIASFYVASSYLANNGGKYDFTLEKRKQMDSEFYFIPISDPQVKNKKHVELWNTQTIPDLLATSKELSKTHEVVTMALGDIVWDNMTLFDDYRESMNLLPVTAFQCIGNHDFDLRYQALNNMPYGSPVYGEMHYNRYFGPTDYSFNIAGVHVVTMKNINYMANKEYREQITEAQVEWLRRDLSYVAKGSTVILNMHAAAWNTQETEGNVLNAEELAEVLKGYKVHVFSGHTHFFQNNQPTANIYEHNIGAACGTWWRSDVNRCGAPNGYMIVKASADTLTWKYKPTGDSADKQMKLYGVGEFYSQPFYLVANVWNCDNETTVEWFEDGVYRGKNQYLLADINKLDEKKVQANVDAITALAEDYSDVPMYMALIPDAANVWADKLPSYAPVEDQTVQIAQIQSMLGDSVNWIDAQGVLNANKDKEIYYHTDSRWTTLGASLVWQQIAADLGLDTSKAPALKPYVVTGDFSGNLSRTSGFESGYREPIYAYLTENTSDNTQMVASYESEGIKTAELYDRTKLDEPDAYEVFLGGDYDKIDIRTTADSTDRLLLVKDSFADCMIPFLIPYYREIIVVDADYYQKHVSDLLDKNKITSVLFLYDCNNFVQDDKLSSILTTDKAE